MSLSHHHKKGYNYIVQLLQHNISTVLQQKQKTKKKKNEAGGKTKTKTKANFAGHHQIPILFASTFIIVMIFISSSHHQSLKITSIITKQKEKKQAKYLTTVTITNKLSPIALLRPSAEVLPHLPVAARHITVRCMRKTTCELCKGGTIWLAMHRPPVIYLSILFSL